MEPATTFGGCIPTGAEVTSVPPGQEAEPCTFKTGSVGISLREFKERDKQAGNCKQRPGVFEESTEVTFAPERIFSHI